METVEKIAEALMAGRAPEVKQLVEQALNDGVEPGVILNEGMLKGMGTIGEKFKKNEVYVPEVLIAARAMKFGMEVLKPRLVEAGVEPVATAVVGTVKGDLHDIGKNLVCMMLEGAGFNVVDAGIDVSPDKFVELVTENKAKVLGLSALLTTTMTSMKDVVEAIKQANLDVRVMVGGAPVTQAFSDDIGACGYAPDAASAATLAKDLISA